MGGPAEAHGRHAETQASTQSPRAPPARTPHVAAKEIGNHGSAGDWTLVIGGEGILGEILRSRSWILKPVRGPSTLTSTILCLPHRSIWTRLSSWHCGVLGVVPHIESLGLVAYAVYQEGKRGINV